MAGGLKARTALLALAGVTGAVGPALASAVPALASGAVAAEQRQVFVYVHAVATTVRVEVDGLAVHRTQHVFGVWDYQFNVSSWLDTQPQKLEVIASFGNRKVAYCTVEVRSSPAGDVRATTVLASKTLHARDLDRWNRATPVVSLEIARPAGSVRPLWADHSGVDLEAVTRSRTADLVREVFDAVHGCRLDALMKLADPALTNQALMEGADPELVKQATRALWQRDCIPGVPVADTRGAFYRASYEDVMTPVNFNKLVYDFSRDPSRQDQRGNLYTPTDSIVIATRDNREFVVRPFFSYTDATRKRRFLSRLLFERVE
jgi:hypothetical protein